VATIDSSVGARSTDYAQALTLAGLLAGASLSLSRLYVGPGWVLPVWLSMACALGLAALLRRFGVGQLLSLLAMAAGFILVTAVLLFPETLIVVIPTRETFAAMAQAIGDALRGVSDQAAPVRVTQEFVFLTCAGAWAVTTAADGLAFRARQPLLALVPVLGLFVFPALIRDSGPAWYAAWFLLGGAGLLLFESRARLATWGRWVSSPRARPAVGWRLPLTRANSIGRWMLAAAALVALTLAWLLPGYGQRPLLDYHSGPNASASIAINPFVSLRTRLNSDANLPVFDVTTAQPTYYRLLVLDRFDGTSFTPSSPTQVVQFGGDTSLDLDGGAPTTQVSQRFTIRQLGGIYLPAAQAPVSAKSGRTTIYQSPTNRDLTLRRPVRSGINYTVTSRVPSPTAADLLGPKSYDSIPGLRTYLDASSIDPKVQSLAVAVAGSKPDPYRKALALQDYLRSSAFKYSLDVPALASGGNQLRRFLLQVRAGYCEQFAAAMAAMARTLGIPSRVAVGFTPGIPQGDHWEVGSKDSHAWPELYFPGVGWVRFEPTPRGDGQVDVPSYTTAAGRLPTPSTTATTVPGENNGSATTLNPGNANRLEAENDQTGSQLGSPESGRERVARSGAVFVILVLVLIALVPATKLVRNALARRRASRMPRDAVAEAYDELTDWTDDAGIGRRPAETPNAYASRMSDEFSEDAEPLTELTRLYVTAEYAAAEPASEEAVQARKLARDARGRLAGRLGWQRRLRATLSPRSLMPPAQARERVMVGRSAHD
jgi:transglutaminase-like putative cysteine protease